MNYDFLRDTQADAWAAQLKREPHNHRGGRLFVEAVLMAAFVGGFAICVYFAVQAG